MDGAHRPISRRAFPAAPAKLMTLTKCSTKSKTRYVTTELRELIKMSIGEQLKLQKPHGRKIKMFCDKMLTIYRTDKVISDSMYFL